MRVGSLVSCFCSERSRLFFHLPLSFGIEMASGSDSSAKFFSKATSNQWLYVLSLYKEVFKIRAQETRGSKKSGPAEAIKLDNWYQEELPKQLQSRKDRQLRHEELVQITKWKLMRTKNRAGLLDLVRINTETAVKQISTKAFKKSKTSLHGAIAALVNLKGIGVATASAILCAGAPDICPFMADECLASVPGIENTNYTINEFIAYADQIKICCDRLQAEDPSAKWNPHKVELALWTHYWIKESKLNLLEKMPTYEGIDENGDESNDVKNGNDSHGTRNGGVGGDPGKGEGAEGVEGEPKMGVGAAVKVGGDSKSGCNLGDDDSNLSVPVSNTSEIEEKSNDSLTTGGGGSTRGPKDIDYDADDGLSNGNSKSSDALSQHKLNHSNTAYNTNSSNSSNIYKPYLLNTSGNTAATNSAYNCIEDAKDGLESSSPFNMISSRSTVPESTASARQHQLQQRGEQIISNGDNCSNLSYSNLSSDDLNNSTAENTGDNTFDGPTYLAPSTTGTATPAAAVAVAVAAAAAESVATASSSFSSSSSTPASASSSSSPTPTFAAPVGTSGPVGSSSADISSTSEPSSPLTPLGSIPAAEVASCSPAPTLLSPVSTVPTDELKTNNNGHIGNGENNHEDEVAEDESKMVSPSPSLKRPLEEMPSSSSPLSNHVNEIVDLDTGSMEKKSRLE